MSDFIKTTILGILCLLTPGLATASHALIGDKVAGLVYTVPGVINNGTLATVFQCTNVATSGTASLGVDVFRSDGSLAGSVFTVPIAPGETKLISTQPVGGVTVDVVIGIGTAVYGAARITGSGTAAHNKLICSAYQISPGATPAYLNALPVIAKKKQKGL